MGEPASRSARDGELLAALRQKGHVLETVNLCGMLLAAELGVEKLAPALTDTAREAVSAMFDAFFHNAVSADGVCCPA